jgi:putative glutathione S-transferase
LKGLHNAISVTFCHPIWQATKSDDVYDTHTGWVFGNPEGEPFYNTAGLGGPFPARYPGTDPDTVNNCFSIREIYEKVNDRSGKYTLPIMWDKKLNTIVSNESSDIMRMLNSEFNEFATNPQVDLYPEELQQKIDYVNAWVYPTFNNGVYRCGFSTTQAVYDNAIDVLTKSFDHINEILKKQHFLVGNQITEADIRLFVTLVRFDEVYAVYFKTNTRCVIMAPAILDFCRRIYQMEGIAETCDMDQIKAHYFCSHAELNKFSVIPRGPGVLDFFSIPLSNKLRYPNL